MYEAGLRQGAVIIAVNDDPVSTLEQFAMAMEEGGFFRGATVPVTIELPRSERESELDLDEEDQQRTTRVVPLSLR